MILKDLPIGTKVREERTSLVFLIADHNHTGYKGTTLITDCAIKLASIDGAEPDNPKDSIKEFGNNFYPHSNIHQWLNSDKADWYMPIHEYDAPPSSDNIDHGRVDFYESPFYSEEAKFTGDHSYQKDPGFLTWFSQGFRDRILESEVHCYKEPTPGVIHFGPPEPYKLKAKVFLLSAPEMGFEKNKNGTEGFRFPLFHDGRMRVAAPIPAAIGRPDDYNYDDCSFYYWLRTPAAGSYTMSMYYNSDHKVGDNNGASFREMPVKAACGIRPALNLDSDATVSDVPDKQGVYTLICGGVYGK